MIKTIREYWRHIRSFSPNALMYLINVIITGAAMGVYRLIFNFFVLSYGYDDALIGNLVTASNLTALLAALPMGYLADMLGRKASLLLSGAVTTLSIAVMVVFPNAGVFLAMNILSGLSQGLAAVTMAPFLMENSQEKERTYLFSFGSGFQMVAASAGNWIGGYLPLWVAGYKAALPTSSVAYSGALVIVTIGSGIGLIPLILLKNRQTTRAQREVFAPLRFAAQQPALLTKLILPMFITSLGAGLIMPFMNVFYREVYHQSDMVIGNLFAWASLAMGIGLLIAPPLADRYGKIPMVVVTQALSIPFLIMLGFSPWFWLSGFAYYVRMALMNMSMPIYSTFVMSNVSESARSTVASLNSMAWNFGWAFSPTVSGWLQVRYGFGPPFVGTISLYMVSIILYWVFFWRKSYAPGSTPERKPELEGEQVT